MKKISILTLALVATLTVFSQQWVSTAAENKKVVLEEFTGKNCGFCPDGHKIANQLAKDNPGKFFAINIHAGSFSPSTAPNYNTTVGAAIDNAAGVTGYPSGSVNRNDNPWGQSRSTWTSKTATILGESSPLNVYVKSSVDYNTRILTTEVEVYYTSNGPGTSNKLSVALLQNGILGPQSGMAGNPDNIVDGKYEHNHMLRMHLTSGNFGESLDTLTSGKYYYRKYNTLLPDDINGVPLDIYNLEVVAFVSEGNNSKILSGHGAEVTHNNPNLVDLTLENISILPTRQFLDPKTYWCENKVTPKAKITNNTITAITAFDVTATVNGIEYKETFSGNLAQGESTTIDWGEKTVAAEGYFSFRLEGFENINGGTTLTEYKPGDNSFSTTLIGVKPKAFSTMDESFEGTSLKNIFLDGYTNPNMSVVTKSSTPYLGAEGTKNAVRFAIHSSWNVAGLGAHIVLGEADFTTVTDDPKLTYYYAYSDGGQGGTVPSIKVSYSTDCGETWTETSSTDLVETGQPPNATSFYTPLSGHYKMVEADLAQAKGMACLVRVSCVPGSGGNAVYIDHISLKSAGGSGGGSGIAILEDSTYSEVTDLDNVSETSIEITSFFKNVDLGDSIDWEIKEVNIPSDWKFDQICDSECIPNVGQGYSRTFVYSTEFKYLKPMISHNKVEGYGYIMVESSLKKDPVNTLTTNKISLLTTKSSSSISFVSDPNEKLLYYFDNTLFVDNEFRNGQIEVFDIRGQKVLDTKIESNNIDFRPLTNGIYVTRVLIDGQVVKSHKFSTAK